MGMPKGMHGPQVSVEDMRLRIFRATTAIQAQGGMLADLAVVVSAENQQLKEDIAKLREKLAKKKSK